MRSWDCRPLVVAAACGFGWECEIQVAFLGRFRSVEGPFVRGWAVASCLARQGGPCSAVEGCSSCLVVEPAAAAVFVALAVVVVVAPAAAAAAAAVVVAAFVAAPGCLHHPVGPTFEPLRPTA